MSTSYDLTVERWVPVIRGDGRPGLASLEEAMLDAHVIAGLDHSDPLVAVALYRLLVALARDV
ncbi:MAG TPA: type I-E CRISPR-associated protein Cse1/CasA, partial [Dermatophilaceae bacterium]|nr:type I-E CRISPR-associated protein Cse1/CasA [Dermatophilaceae bacterium]